MKLVREYIINEKFTEESDPITDIGIGLKVLIDNWINFMNGSSGQHTENKIINYKINNNGSIDVGNPKLLSKIKQILSHIYNGEYRELPEAIEIRGDVISKFPDFIKFNKCYGSCYINCSTIETLKGCPRIVYGHFCVNNNINLKNIDFLPKIIYGDLYMHECGSKFEKDSIRKICKIYGKITL